jgi:hypothetical protein
MNETKKRPPRSADHYQPGKFYTDKQLTQRWQCSDMKLWRLRKDGKLPKPLKIGGTGDNLTPLDAVEALERGNA